ncbi:antibiotic biosynthesis monooxygenase [Sphingomonas sp. ST-64]|uniref:Antibiotic biosynthesis monooxygenase n=1 Tax=Sphingomonas plantiphila TaxID=3163295 RepID=A0ABW8YNK0_9SPHN
MLIQRYELRAKDGAQAALQDRLEAMARWLIRRGGCTRVEILSHIAEPECLSLVEYWPDEECRRAAGIAMDRAMLQGIKDASVSIDQHGLRRHYLAQSRSAIEQAAGDVEAA